VNPEQITEFKNRLLPQAIALAEQATGVEGDRQLADVLVNACKLLEISVTSEAPIMSVERVVNLSSGTYSVEIRRLSSSVPPGKFQILISRELASGLIY
jgi:hypothetical protein